MQEESELIMADALQALLLTQNHAVMIFDLETRSGEIPRSIKSSSKICLIIPPLPQLKCETLARV